MPFVCRLLALVSLLSLALPTAYAITEEWEQVYSDTYVGCTFAIPIHHDKLNATVDYASNYPPQDIDHAVSTLARLEQILSRSKRAVSIALPYWAEHALNTSNLRTRGLDPAWIEREARKREFYLCKYGVELNITHGNLEQTGYLSAMSSEQPSLAPRRDVGCQHGTRVYCSDCEHVNLVDSEQKGGACMVDTTRACYARGNGKCGYIFRAAKRNVVKTYSWKFVTNWWSIMRGQCCARDGNSAAHRLSNGSSPCDQHCWSQYTGTDPDTFYCDHICRPLTESLDRSPS